MIRAINHFDGTFTGLEQIVFADGSSWDRTAIQANAWFRGTDGVDTITGSGGPETIDGRGGDDILRGKEGSDTYIYGVGSGNDTIEEAGTGSDVDKVKLVGLNPADVDVWRVLNDLFVKIVSTGEILKIAAHFSWEPSGVEQLVFADGTVWNRATIETLAWWRGTEGVDTITASSGPDTLDGRGGDDILRGKEGSDTYIYGAGSGNDTIEEAGTGSDVDKVKLVGLNSADVDVWRVVNDLFVKILSTGETLKVAAHFSWEPSGVEQLVFADGTVWDRATIESLAWFRGTGGVDTIDGTDGPNTIDGRGGDDLLRGKEASDTYIYGVGSGNDTIVENGFGSDVDKLKLIGLNPADIDLWRVGSDLFVKVLSSGETVKVQAHFSWEPSGLEQLVFADGTIWNRATIETLAWYRGTEGADVLNGTGAAETFDGRGGNDTINGGDGNDTLNGGAGANSLNGGNGNDTFFGGLDNDSLFSAAGSDIFIYRSGDGSDFIDEESGSTAETDILRFTDLNVADITVSRIGNDVVVRINSAGHQIEFDEQFWSSDWYGIDRVEFANGTVWDRAAISANAWIRGTTGADSLSVSSGVNGNETFFGDLGNNSFFSTGGGDIFIYRSGDGSDFINEESGSTAETERPAFHRCQRG